MSAGSLGELVPLFTSKSTGLIWLVTRRGVGRGGGWAREAGKGGDGGGGGHQRGVWEQQALHCFFLAPQKPIGLIWLVTRGGGGWKSDQLLGSPSPPPASLTHPTPPPCPLLLRESMQPALSGTTPPHQAYPGVRHILSTLSTSLPSALVLLPPSCPKTTTGPPRPASTPLPQPPLHCSHTSLVPPPCPPSPPPSRGKKGSVVGGCCSCTAL